MRLQQPGHRGVPAVPVLQQRRPVAELTGGLEVLRGRVEVALLAEHVGQADVQVAGGGQHRAGWRLGRGQRAFVEPARLVGPAAGQPHAGQHDGGAELVGDVAGRVQAARPPRVNVSTAVPRSPAAQAARPRKPAAPPRARWSSGPASSRARRACATVPSTSPRAWATEAR